MKKKSNPLALRVKELELEVKMLSAIVSKILEALQRNCENTCGKLL